MDHADLEAIDARQQRGYRGEDPMQVYLDNVKMLADLYHIRNMLGCAEGEHPAVKARAIRLGEPVCTCTAPARDAHDRDCPVRRAHPRRDLGDT